MLQRESESGLMAMIVQGDIVARVVINVHADLIGSNISQEQDSFH
jgi:hypothetical protein